MRRLFFCLLLTGCNLPLPKPDGGRLDPPAVQTVKLEITVNGEGKINLGGDARITAKGPAADTACPCGCGEQGCTCGRTSPMSSRSPPRTQRVLICENGTCRWVDQPTGASPGFVSSVPLKLERGKVTLFVEPLGQRESPATTRARSEVRQLGFKIDVERTHNPPGGWWPTLAWTDGSGQQRYWSPGATGWHDGSAAEAAATIQGNR